MSAEPTKLKRGVEQSITIYPNEISYVQKPSDGQLRGTCGFSFIFDDLLHEGRPDEAFEEALAWLEATAREWWKSYKRARARRHL